MKKNIALITMILLIFSSFTFGQTIGEIKFTGSIVTEANAKLLLVDSDKFKVAWQSDSNADFYEVRFVSNELDIKENVKTTEFEVKGMAENSRGFFTVKGIDKSGNTISQSSSLIVAYPPSESKSLSIEKPQNRVLSKENYADFSDSVFSFNYVSGMEKFRIKIFSGDKIYRDRLQLINMGTFPKEIDDGLDKDITVEVSAIAGDKVISTESFNIGYFNEAKSNYSLDIQGYDANKPYWSNSVRIDFKDNHQDINNDSSTYYKVIIKNTDTDEIRNMVTSIANDSYSNAYITTILENGSYDITAEAIKPLSYKEGFNLYEGHTIEELVSNIATSETLGRDTLNIQVLGQSNAIYAPSVWARDSVDGIVNYIPNSLNSNYKDNVTRREVCNVLVPLYENFSGRYIFPKSDVFDDTDDPFVSVAYLNSLVKGKSEKIFDPNGNITREEFAVVIVNVCKGLGYNIDGTEDMTFNDKDNISSWAQKSVSYLASNKVFNGSTDGSFNPKSNITREEAYVVINNLLKFISSKLEY